MSKSMAANPRLELAARFSRYFSVLLLVAMFVGTHIPTENVPGIGMSDKLVHFGAYLALSLSVLVSWELSVGVLQPPHYFAVWLAGTLYGAIDEITQTPFGRTCDGSDWLADVAGLIVGLILFQIVRPLIYRLPLGFLHQ